MPEKIVNINLSGRFAWESIVMHQKRDGNVLDINKEEYSTESDVEQKFILPFFTKILGYGNEEIKTKDYLAPTTIDKGAGKKVGYYPDYVVYIGGIPVIVIEAKDKSVNSLEGYREARLYATELNKKYPEGINPIKYILATNGDRLQYGFWDSEIGVNDLDISELCPGAKALDNIELTIGRRVLFDWAKEIRAKIFPEGAIRPLSLIGGPSRQSESIQSNTFASDLAPLLRRYFDPDVTATSQEIIERAYCSSTEVTQYNATLESLLKDRVPKQSDITKITTSKKHASELDGALKGAYCERRNNPDPFILLLGGVGSGKTTFVQRYFNHLIEKEIRDNIIYVVVNFNNASDSLDDVEKWVCQEIIDRLVDVYGEEFLSSENLDRYFAPDIRLLKRGPLSRLEEADKLEFAKIISTKLIEWFDDPIKLCSGIMRFYSGDKDIPVVVVFDNVDRRDREQQLKIFQTVQWFRNKNKCFSILSLRDETYDAFRNQPPLDAFLKPFAFRISSPRFINVVKKRLELVIEYLTEQSDKNLEYELPNGITIHYPATKLGKYLFSIYRSIFDPSRKVSVMLEALSGKNIRRALEIFTEILISGYISENLIFGITEGNGKGIPEWLIIRVLMRTNYRYYSRNHGYIYNIFSTPGSSSTANNFLVPEILEYLARNRKNTSSYSIEGYMYVQDILEYMSGMGYVKEDVMWALEELLVSNLISADHQRNKGIREIDYIKITASGYYHIRLISSRSEYLSNVPFDTYIYNYDIAKKISQNREDSRNQAILRTELMREYLEDEVAKLREAFPIFNDNAISPDVVVGHFTKIRQHREGNA
ncbi:type I restriction endonuclease [Methylotuvimicrobium sp. KM1]|uniref:type I restriction endonuclease n=1 Tax=Methylotuvimicrobium sp. KM1 TaxID=3377707 RepID=UPI003851356D